MLQLGTFDLVLAGQGKWGRQERLTPTSLFFRYEGSVTDSPLFVCAWYVECITQRKKVQLMPAPHERLLEQGLIPRFGRSSEIRCAPLWG